MHPIASWMVTIDLHDEIQLTRREDPPLSLYGIEWHQDAIRKPEIDWPISSDPAARAHQALEGRTARRTATDTHGSVPRRRAPQS